MHSASPTIGAIATALAKAQSELENPEKTMSATIATGDGGRSFRYASLASGLDLVRKCLGQHEIAVMQTTALHQAQIILTTLLVHASGEWVSSTWPVCAAAEPSVHVKGAALTYARRYALFALVGIAGEDDLDAPDLPATGSSNEPQKRWPESERSRSGQNPPPAVPTLHRPPQRSGRHLGPERPKAPPLSAADSGKLKQRLISELTQLGNPEALATWAHRVLPLKNQLSAADALTIENAFAAKLNARRTPTVSEGIETPAPKKPKGRRQAAQVVPLTKPVRERDRNHLRFVASRPCLVCGRAPSDAHHLKFAEQRVMGRKVSDKFTVPICRLHHRDLHRHGDERIWWTSQGIDPLPIAATLWERTHNAKPADTELAGNTGTFGEPKHAVNGSGASTPRRNDKTKPILQPEVR